MHSPFQSQELADDGVVQGTASHLLGTPVWETRVSAQSWALTKLGSSGSQWVKETGWPGWVQCQFPYYGRVLLRSRVGTSLDSDSKTRRLGANFRDSARLGLES